MTPKRRSELYAMFDGHCAYCGNPLPLKGWHADHIEPVIRDFEYYSDEKTGLTKTRATGKLYKPENQRADNYFPACAACNIDKGAETLESWRESLKLRVDVCRRNHAIFRHLERFGRIVIVDTPLLFHFEKVALAKEQ